MPNQQIETVAYIVKEERIAAITDQIKPGTLVVEPLEPYPGYHGLNLPDVARQTPGDVFLLTKKRNSAEQIAHLTRKIISGSEIVFNAARSELFFFNETYPGIRIRGLEQFSQIETIQNWYADFGINFAKKEKVDTKAIIKIQKMLCAEEVALGIWQDLENAEMRYFEIPKEITWQQFATITLKIKRNHDSANYDVALGGIFRRERLVDMIRVYSNRGESIEETAKIRDIFNQEIQNL